MMKWFLLLFFLISIDSFAQKCSKYVDDSFPYRYIKLHKNKKFEYHPCYMDLGWVGKIIKGKYEIRDSFLFIYGNKTPKGKTLESEEKFNPSIAPDSFRITIINTEKDVQVLKINSDFHIGMSARSEEDTIIEMHRLLQPIQNIVLYTLGHVFPPIIVNNNKANDFFIKTYRPAKRNDFLYFNGERFKITNDKLFLISQDFEDGKFEFVKTLCK